MCLVHKLIDIASFLAGAYLTFLTAIEEGNANMLPCPTDPTRKLIHFAKRQKCADVIREIQQYQATPYTFISLPVVQTFVRERLENVENGPDAYELSLKLEPREREDEKM
jgi:son of sevenless-like protein